MVPESGPVAGSTINFMARPEHRTSAEVSYPRRVRMLFVVVVAACHPPHVGPTPAPNAPTTARELPPPKAGPATHTVVLAPGSPTPIMRGPFEITSINPGGSLELSVGTSDACAGAVWFAYSGG